MLKEKGLSLRGQVQGRRTTCRNFTIKGISTYNARTVRKVVDELVRTNMRLAYKVEQGQEVNPKNQQH